MKRILSVFVVLAFLFQSLAALAEDLAAAALEGAWVVTVGEQPRDRFLIVRGAKTEKDEVHVATAVYGWIDGKGKEVGNWKAQILGDEIKLSYVTPADSLINVAFKSVDTSVSGELTSKGGKKYNVRMTRLDDEELAALREAAASAKKGQSDKQASAKKASKTSKPKEISLVYVGADNCPPCAGFRPQMENNGRLFKQSNPELAEARIVHVQLGYYVAAVPESQLPADLKWLLQPNSAGKLPLRKRGTPFFAAVVDHRVVAQGHGFGALETLVSPAIKRAVEERSAAN
jgi:hypothetical protein